jgi:hypothetical protein
METSEILRALNCKFAVELFLGDNWYDQPELYSTAYFEKWLRITAPFASTESVSIYLGRSTTIRSLIANYQTSTGKQAIKQTGWGWVDNESFDVVNSYCNTSRANGMVSNRESAIVVYMKGWKTRAHKKIYTENARNPDFWTTFPDIWRPPQAHQGNVLTNTLTGYRYVRKYLKNPETNARVRSSSEKNPMLYLYLMQKYTKGPGSLVMDCFGGTFASVLAAMHTDNKVVIFEEDKKCAKIAKDRVLVEAMKITNKAGAPLGEIKSAMKEKRNRRRTKAEDELLEYSYGKMVSPECNCGLTDPRFPPPAVYNVDKAAASYGVEIKEVKTHAIGKGLFAAKEFLANSFVVPVLGRWVRQTVMKMKVNSHKEYIAFAGEDRRQWAFEMDHNQLAVKINDYRGVADAPNCCIAVDHGTLKEYHQTRAKKAADFFKERKEAVKESEGEGGEAAEDPDDVYIDMEEEGFIHIRTLDAKVSSSTQFFMDYGNVYWRGRRDLGGKKKKKAATSESSESDSDDAVEEGEDGSDEEVDEEGEEEVQEEEDDHPEEEESDEEVQVLTPEGDPNSEESVEEEEGEEESDDEMEQPPKKKMKKIPKQKVKIKTPTREGKSKKRKQSSAEAKSPPSKKAKTGKSPKVTPPGKSNSRSKRSGSAKPVLKASIDSFFKTPIREEGSSPAAKAQGKAPRKKTQNKKKTSTESSATGRKTGSSKKSQRYSLDNI